MNTLTMFVGMTLGLGAALLLVLRLLRDRLGEMPRLLVSPLLCLGAFAGGSRVYVRWTGTELPGGWYLLGLILCGYWATIVIVWAADEGRDLPAADRTPPGHWPTGLLGRHWRGELPLWAAFWIVCCLLVPYLAGAAKAFVGALDLDPTIDEPTFEVVLLTVTTLTLAMIAWALRGVWKSALRSRAATSRGRFGRLLPLGIAGLAAVGLLFLAIASTALVAVVAHRLWSRPGDEPIADIRAVRGGREIVIDGVLSPGIARRFRSVLIEAPKARIVHLNSPGGSMHEAYRLATLIRRHRLETYVPERCSSACTLTFAAGRRRWVADETIIEFHSPAVEMLRSLGIPHGPIQRRIVDELYQEMGVSPRLIALIRQTPFEYPHPLFPSELQEYGLATDLADPDRFAASGWPIGDWYSAANFLKKRYPIFVTAEKFQPDEFEVIVEMLRSEYEIGSSPSKIFEKLRPHIDEMIELSVRRMTDGTKRD